MKHTKGLSDVVPDINEGDTKKWNESNIYVPVHQIFTN